MQRRLHRGGAISATFERVEWELSLDIRGRDFIKGKGQRHRDVKTKPKKSIKIGEGGRAGSLGLNISRKCFWADPGPDDG